MRMRASLEVDYGHDRSRMQRRIAARQSESRPWAAMRAPFERNDAEIVCVGRVKAGRCLIAPAGHLKSRLSSRKTRRLQAPARQNIVARPAEYRSRTAPALAVSAESSSSLPASPLARAASADGKRRASRKSRSSPTCRSLLMRPPKVSGRHRQQDVVPDAHAERTGDLAQTLIAGRSVAFGLVALDLLLLEAEPFGERLLAEAAGDPRLDEAVGQFVERA